MRLLTFISSCVGLVSGFCEDGISIPDLKNTGDVIVTWAQAPLFSTSPEINQTGKYLHLFHTALVFRQNNQYWTLEFDAVADDLMYTILPLISEDGKDLTWRNTDARWCLRTGIYNGRQHWTTHFDDVATITPVQMTQVFEEFIPMRNSTVSGAWPQYQFWRVQEYFTGEISVEDTTCGNVWGLLVFIRDVMQVPLLKMDYKATRVTLPSLGTSVVNMKDADARQEVIDFYTALSGAVDGKGGVYEFQAIFQVFMPWKFVYDPVSQQYFKINLGAPGEVVLILYTRYEVVGDLSGPPDGDECNVSPSCSAVMSTHYHSGMGDACKDSLGSKSRELVAGGCHANATHRAREVDCFCGSQCYVKSDCLEEMTKHCERGDGETCKDCLILAFPEIALFGPCKSNWGPSAIMDKGKTRACFCDSSQWKPKTAEFLIA